MSMFGRMPAKDTFDLIGRSIGRLKKQYGEFEVVYRREDDKKKGYTDAVYDHSPLEQHAEHFGIIEAYLYLEGIEKKYSFDADFELTKVINSDDIWYSPERPVGNVADAIEKLDRAFAVMDHGVDINAPYKCRKGGPSDLCQALRDDKDLRNRYESSRPNRNNELAQQDVLLAWIRRHPTDDILLFPCLSSYFSEQLKDFNMVDQPSRDLERDDGLERS